ncbi:hypothetical protein H4R26_005304, partial [Coemansia thaxteri]
MQLALLVAQVLAVSALAAPVVFKRQQISSDGGDSVSAGSTAVSNPIVNNGEMVDSSIINNGSDGGDTFANVIGSSFTKVTSNNSNKDNIVINPSTTTVNGNSGQTANGMDNHVGDTQHVAGVPALWRRNAVFSGAVLDDVHYGYGHEAVYDYPQIYYPHAEPHYEPIY